MKISIVIPCYYKHVIHLNELLNSYKNQTVLPNEIVCVITEAHKIQNMNILTANYPFELNIIKLDKKSTAGNTRKIGAYNATGDIIILQDADDLPSINRIEIIKNIFEKNKNKVFVCHQWSKKNIVNNRILQPKYIIPKYNMFRRRQFRKKNHIANGNIAFRKKILKNIKWFPSLLRRQDIATNVYIADKYKGKCIFIKEKLLYYRIENSSQQFTKFSNKNNKIIINEKLTNIS